MKIEFDAVLIKDTDSEGFYCEFPYNVEETFGKKRVKIKAMLDGVGYRGLLTPMCGVYRVMLNKAVREKVGKPVGSTVHVSVEEDTDPRVVEVPEEMAAAMDDAGVSSFFNTLSYTHQKEYVQWVQEAKKLETKQSRLAKAIEMMRQKIKSR